MKEHSSTCFDLLEPKIAKAQTLRRGREGRRHKNTSWTISRRSTSECNAPAAASSSSARPALSPQRQETGDPGSGHQTASHERHDFGRRRRPGALLALLSGTRRMIGLSPGSAIVVVRRLNLTIQVDGKPLKIYATLQHKHEGRVKNKRLLPSSADAISV